MGYIYILYERVGSTVKFYIVHLKQLTVEKLLLSWLHLASLLAAADSERQQKLTIKAKWAIEHVTTCVIQHAYGADFEKFSFSPVHLASPLAAADGERQQKITMDVRIRDTVATASVSPAVVGHGRGADWYAFSNVKRFIIFSGTCSSERTKETMGTRSAETANDHVTPKKN